MSDFFLLKRDFFCFLGINTSDVLCTNCIVLVVNSQLDVNLLVEFDSTMPGKWSVITETRLQAPVSDKDVPY